MNRLVGWLHFNGTFSINTPYRAISAYIPLRYGTLYLLPYLTLDTALIRAEQIREAQGMLHTAFHMTHSLTGLV